MAIKIKYVCILGVIPLIFSCASRKCCPDLFSWSRGKVSPGEFDNDNAVSVAHKIYTFSGPASGAFNVYDTTKKKWSQLPSIPKKVSSVSSAVMDQNIYLLGGRDTLSQYSDAFQKFDLLQNKWETLPSLKNPVSGAAAVVCNDKLYLIGGVGNMNGQFSRYSSRVEAYDPMTLSWQKKSDLPTARYGHAAICINDKIIVAGGITDEGGTAVVEEYDPITDSWTRLADLPSHNSFFGLIEVKNRIYAFGGYGYAKSSPIIRYDVNADQWTEVGNMPEILSAFGIAINGSKIYIVGGKDYQKSFWVAKKK